MCNKLWRHPWEEIADFATAPKRILPGRPSLHTTRCMAAVASPDPWYELGSRFLRLPARATRDGSRPGEVVGTAVHVDLYGRPSCEAALAVAVEPATGEVLCLRAIHCSSAFEAYEEAFWGVICAYLRREPASKPASLTSSDRALADYIFGLLQGCGTDVACIDASSQRVQWPASLLRETLRLPHPQPATEERAAARPAPAEPPAPTHSLPAFFQPEPEPAAEAGRAEDAPLVADVMAAVVEALAASGEASALLRGAAGEEGRGAGERGAAPAGNLGTAHGPEQLVLLGACHHAECGKLLPRRKLKRCSACKVMLYCSAACQAENWTAGGHRQVCRELQSMREARVAGGGRA